MARPNKLPTTHGLSKSRLYSVWCNMRSRCDNPKVPCFERYGARGISYDPKWNRFENFYNDMVLGFDDHLTLDRTDNKLGYSKDNCRWATIKTQNRNTRRNHYLEYNGMTECVTEWAEYLGVSRSTFSMRYYAYGWSLDKLIGAYL